MAPLVHTLRQADMPRARAGTRGRPRPCVVLAPLVVVGAAVAVVVLPCRVTHSLRHVLGQKQRTGHSRTVSRSVEQTLCRYSAADRVGQNF